MSIGYLLVAGIVLSYVWYKNSPRRRQQPKRRGNLKTVAEQLNHKNTPDVPNPPRATYFGSDQWLRGKRKTS